MTRLTDEELKTALQTHPIVSDTGAVDIRKVAQQILEYKPNKLRNVPIEVDGIKFQSTAEGRRYAYLVLLEQAGEISSLHLQPKYRLFDKFTDNFGRNYRAAHYIGDFAYVRDGQAICEDCKGHPTAKWALQWKLAIRAYPNVKFEVVKK